MKTHYIEITRCMGCPYFKVSEGYRTVWYCDHRDFLGGVRDPRRKDNVIGRINKDGSYPKYANRRVALGCPLPVKAEEKVKKYNPLLKGYIAMINNKLYCFETYEDRETAIAKASKKRDHSFICFRQYDPQKPKVANEEKQDV